MKIFNKTKKIILIWDYDAPIGQINATLPYNFDNNTFNKEKSNVTYALSKLDEYSVKYNSAVGAQLPIPQKDIDAAKQLSKQTSSAILDLKDPAFKEKICKEIRKSW